MATIHDPLRIGSLHLKNRLYRAPVLEGAGGSPDPARAYARHFVPNAEAGAALVIQGNTIVNAEGRTSPGMSAVAGRESLMELAPMTAEVHAAGGRIVIQLGHGGLFALESWHRTFESARSAPPLCASAPPLWLRPLYRQFHVPATAEVAALVARFGRVALWAREAGYDGVQLAGANAKLLHQFLSSTYNRRSDRYGGDVEGRTTILREIREAIAREAGADYPVLLKYTAVELGLLGGGITAEEGIAIARIAERCGYAAVTPAATGVLPDSALSRGAYPGAAFDNARLARELGQASGGGARQAVIKAGMWLSSRRYPFEAIWNHPVFSEVSRAVSIPVFAVGGIRTRAHADAILEADDAAMVGIGRPFYAEPDLPRKLLAGAFTSACENSNRCVVGQMMGLPGACMNPRVHQRLRAAGTPRAQAAAERQDYRTATSRAIATS